MDYITAIVNSVVVNAPYLVGFVLPPIVEVLNRDVKKEKERYVVSLIVCFLVAILLHWKEIAYGTPEQVLAFTGLIFMESNTIYKLYFAKSWLKDAIQKKTMVEETEALGPVTLPVSH